MAKKYKSWARSNRHKKRNAPSRRVSRFSGFQLEGVSCGNSREDTAFALERVAEEQVFGDGHVNLQLFFDVDAEAEADMVVRGAVSQRVRGEEVAIVAAEAIVAGILRVNVTLRVENGLLTANADDEPVPPDVTFDTEADHAADIATLVPVRIVFVLGVVEALARRIVERPVVGLQLVPDEVAAQPEEAAIQRDVDAEADLGVLVVDTRSLDEVHGERRDEFAVDRVKREERAGIGEEGEVTVVKEVLVFGAVLDTGKAEAELEVDAAAELEVQACVALHDGGKGILGHLVGTVLSHVAAVLVGDVDVQAPGVAVGKRAAQEAVKVRHGLGNLGRIVCRIANDAGRQILGERRCTPEQATDGKTRVRIPLIAERNREDATEVRMLRVEVLPRLHVLRIRAEFTNQVVRVEIDVCGVVENAHVIHDVRSVLAHGFDTGKSRKGGTDTHDAERHANCGS